jgi:hypothetical protein
MCLSSKRLFTVIFTCWITLAGLSPVCAQQEPSPPPAVSVQAAADDLRDPEAIAELKRATAYLTALQRFHIKASVVYDVVQGDGRRLLFEKSGDVYLQRPDRLFADVFLDDGRHRQIWYDGKTLSFAERSRQIYTQLKAPPKIDEMLDLLEELLRDPMPLADLFYSDLSPLDQRAIEADVVGESQVNGRPCLHLAFRGKTVDWQLWVEQGAKPLIRKLVITYREEPGTPQSVAVIDTWETPESFSDGMFNFVVPGGSQFVNVLVPPMPEKGGKP